MTPHRDTFEIRRHSALDAAARLHLDGLLISSLPNIRYLTGFTGDNALLLLEPSRHILLTDPRYKFQAQKETTCHVRVVRRPLIPEIAARLKNTRIRRLGIESERLTHAQFLQLDENLPDKVQLTPTRRLVESLRAVKSPEELDLIRKSAQLACQALNLTLPLLRPGVTELDIAAELVYRMRKVGADGPSFDPIVAFGPNSALPHARATSTKLKTKSIILIDCGAFFRGYASDLTRVLHLGTPGPEIRRLHSVVLEAQQSALDSLRPDILASHVDRCARNVLRKHGLHKAFLHATGHGLGLEIHELPRLGASERTPLSPGMALTIEPGVYLQELGGIRIEDTVALHQTGIEVLTPASKELIVI